VGRNSVLVRVSDSLESGGGWEGGKYRPQGGVYTSILKRYRRRGAVIGPRGFLEG